MMRLPWTEKYRPQKREDFILNSTIINILESFTRDNITNIIFSGRSGNGKTSLSYYICDYLDIDFVEYNASDTRGVDTIYEIINIYKNRERDKIVFILDEIDNMTIKAQEMIVNLIDLVPNILFIMTCNNIEQVVFELYERSINLEISCRGEEKTLMDRLLYITRQEEMDVDEATIKKYIYDFDFDIRMILNHLEFVSRKNGDAIIISHNTKLFEEIMESRDLAFMYDMFDKHKKEIIGKNNVDFIHVMKSLIHNSLVYESNESEKEDKVNYSFAGLDTKKKYDLLEIIHRTNIDINVFSLNSDLQILKMLGDLHRCYHS